MKKIGPITFSPNITLYSALLCIALFILTGTKVSSNYFEIETKSVIKFDFSIVSWNLIIGVALIYLLISFLLTFLPKMTKVVYCILTIIVPYSPVFLLR